MEFLREGLPVLLGAGVPLVVNVRAGHGPWRRIVMAALLVLAGLSASALNGELASWPSGVFAVVFDSALAGLGALVSLRLLRRGAAPLEPHLRTRSTGNSASPPE
jgi:hypothetical protein